MILEEQQLLTRIEQAPLIDHDADRLFTRKLVQQNGWSPDRARQALVEYRRFLFLAMAAGHPVAPSDAVDQVWHLHLLSTEDYWKRFCPHVLGRPFHHAPSRGERGEQSRFEDWYGKTLVSYTRYFGEPPPSDLWPAPDRKVELDQHVQQRVDREEFWVMAKRRWLHQSKTVRRNGRPAAVGLLLLIIPGCMALGLPSPWKLSGPDFLSFFIPLMLTCFVLAAVGRNRSRLAALTSREPVDREVYDHVQDQNVGSLQKAVAPYFQEVADRLKELGLLGYLGGLLSLLVLVFGFCRKAFRSRKGAPVSGN